MVYRKSNSSNRQHVNIPVFRGSYHQKGYGLGSTIFKIVLPFLKWGLAAAGKRALNVGANTLNTIAENDTSMKDAYKNQLHQEYHTYKEGINRPSSSPSVSVGKTRTKKRHPKRAKGKAGFRKITL